MDAPFPDSRLNARARLLLRELIQSPAPDSTPQQTTPGSAAWAHAVGRFRFFDNDRVSLPALYQPCIAALQGLIPKSTRALVLHDVSVLDYSHHDRKEDLIAVGNGAGYGYELCTSLVLSAQGDPLGPLSAELRTAHGLLSSQTDSVLPFTDHLEQAQRAAQYARAVLPERELVHIGDREFDDLALLRSLGDQSFVIRAQHLKRRVLQDGRESSLKSVTDSLPLIPMGTVERREKTAMRTYSVFIAETKVILHGLSQRGVATKRSRPQPGIPLAVRVVVTELRSDAKSPLRWVLLTNLSDSLEHVVQLYLWRWRIERLFYLVKCGFQLEQWNQESGDRIARRLGITHLAAMVLYQLQSQESAPDASALLRTLASMGGWLGRKRDPIGPIVLMRGMMRLLSTLELLDQYGEAELRQLAARLRPGHPDPSTPSDGGGCV